ncbi:MAG: helix-turn-helix domain-containing protein [Prevotella sp.]|nr:helix-turn-helix domain-containing protein [Prevotella sp.]
MGNETTMPQAIYMITAEQLKEYAQEVAQKILEGSKNVNSSDNLLTVDDVCAKFKVNRVTVWRWEQDGLLKGKRMGRRKYYAAADIEKIMNE